MKKILFAASECVPFIKTGGLADVCGALPKEFDKERTYLGYVSYPFDLTDKFLLNNFKNIINCL